MARNRTIYNTQALYVSIANATGAQTQAGSIEQLSRVQSFDEDFTRNLTDVNQYGNLAAIDRIEVENPDVTASFSYYLTDGQNEKNIGLNIYPVGTPKSELRSCISGFLSKATDEKNYYLLITEEGFDASNYVGSKSGVIGVGNGFLTSYSVNVAVGEIPTADVEIEGLNVRVYGNLTGNHPIPSINPVDGTNFEDRLFKLRTAQTITGENIPTALQPGDVIFSLESNQVLGFDGADLKIQDFTLSFDLARTPLQRLGNRFAFSREIDFPVTASLEVNAEVGDLASGNLADLLCSETEKEFTILMKEPGCGADKDTALAYIFKGAKLVSQNFSSAIGDNATMSATYEVQLGGPQDTDKGIFISGSFCDNSTANIIVEGDTLFFDGINNGKPQYSNETYTVYWDGGSSQWTYDEIGTATISLSTSDVDYPWLVEDWIPSISVQRSCPSTECADQNAHIRYKDIIFYKDNNIVNGRDSYTALNGYAIGWIPDQVSPGVNAWVYTENTPGNDEVVTSDALYPWEAFSPSEKLCP